MRQPLYRDQVELESRRKWILWKPLLLGEESVVQFLVAMYISADHFFLAQKKHLQES